MGLQWVRLDTQFFSNPKVLELTSTARWRTVAVYLASLTYAGTHGTDGYIPETALPFIHATKQNAIDLVKLDLWHQDIHGWRINDWSEYQVCDDAAVIRSDKARRAALARWKQTDAQA